MTFTERETTFKVHFDKSRSGGLHASQLIRPAGIRARVVKPFGDEDGTIPMDEKVFDAQATLRIIMGNAWEAEWLHQMPDLIPHPSEFELRGISMSPDAISWEPDPLAVVTSAGVDLSAGKYRVHECKLTYKRMPDHPEALWDYLCQLKLYCKAVGTTSGALHVLFCCGNYKPPRPTFRRWDLEFTQLELDENFDMIHGFAKAEGKL